MTTAYDIDWPAVLAERLTTANPDMLRELLSMYPYPDGCGGRRAVGSRVRRTQR